MKQSPYTPRPFQAKDHNHIGRKFYNAMRSGNLEDAEAYLTIMADAHIQYYPNNPTALEVFIAAHIVSALDLSGHQFFDSPTFRLQDVFYSEARRYFECEDSCSHSSKQMVHRIFSFIYDANPVFAPSYSNKIVQICDYIDERYADLTLSVNSISELFSLSPSYLSRMFHEKTGEKLVDYIRDRRIQKVKELLFHTELSINQIAEQTGFPNGSALIRTFRKSEGITPGAFREQISLM